MGDRAQLEITNGKTSMFFYTHWGGHELAQTLARGLTVGRMLEEDQSYCLGSVLREMVRACGGLEDTTGLGLGFNFCDNDDSRGAPLVLNVTARTVRYKDHALPVAEFLADPAKLDWR